VGSVTLLHTVRRLDALVTRAGGRRQILVDSRTAANYGMVAPVARAMAVDDRVRFSFTASEEPSSLRRIYKHAPPGVRLVGPRRAAFSRWDAYLTSDFMWATLPRGTSRIQMFHGVGAKYGFDAPSESMRQWDRLFFVNERRLRNAVRSGALDPGSRAATLGGMPKVDCLVDGSLRRDDTLTRLGLDPSRKTVLYAPTWSPASSLNTLGVALIERLAQMPINVIVKLHDRSRDLRPSFSGGVDWVTTLRPLLSSPQTMLAKGANIAPYLVASDVLITDHSSAGFEYLLLDRPLVRIEVPALIAQASIHQDYLQLLAAASSNVSDADGARQAVERALANPVAHSTERRRVAADLFYRPGTATARCALALYEVMELTPHPSIVRQAGETEPCLRSA
jgi:hypothetical protein